MPRRRIADDELFAHFITFTVYRRRRLLDHDYPKRILLGVLADELRDADARCIGFVVMPNHVHSIVWFPRPKMLSGFMHGWKRKSSFHIRNWYRVEAANYFRDFGEGVRFWQAKYYAFEIFERTMLEQKLQYMHMNPVRVGLVERPEHWKWSSARWYELGKPCGVPIRWVD